MFFKPESKRERSRKIEEEEEDRGGGGGIKDFRTYSTRLSHTGTDGDRSMTEKWESFNGKV
jgi:hypothetical protein